MLELQPDGGRAWLRAGVVTRAGRRARQGRPGSEGRAVRAAGGRCEALGKRRPSELFSVLARRERTVEDLAVPIGWSVPGSSSSGAAVSSKLPSGCSERCSHDPFADAGGLASQVAWPSATAPRPFSGGRPCAGRWHGPHPGVAQLTTPRSPPCRSSGPRRGSSRRSLPAFDSNRAADVVADEEHHTLVVTRLRVPARW
jgi:hypothetical protein